ncbi:MAG: hypothetical protein AB8B80_09245 [Marinicellaceae bacterium]
MQNIIKLMLIIVAIIHLLPISGVLSVDRLAVLYGLSIRNPNLEILMRHRAILFGILGLFLLYSAFKPKIQFLGFIAGFASVISFLVLSMTVGSYNSQIHRVFIADIIALVCLLVGLTIYLYQRYSKKIN